MQRTQAGEDRSRLWSKRSYVAETYQVIERFVRHQPRARAIFLNSPHNPTGGVTTPDDLRGIAELVRGRNIAILSDEPYCHMVWEGRHHTILEQPGMIAQSVAAYTFSKSYSMSGWRLG